MNPKYLLAKTNNTPLTQNNMKKRIYTTAVALATLAVSLSFVSCDIFEGDGFGDRNVGNLDANFPDNDLPAGYRIKSVGEIRYFYKSTGKLDIIRVGNTEFDLDKKSLTFVDDGGVEKYTFSFNANNNLKKMKMSYHEEEGDDEGEGSFEFTYNIDRQLTNISGNYTETYTENGQDVKSKITSNMEITYDAWCVKRIRIKSEERQTIGGKTDKETYSATIGFSYDRDDDEFDNRYYQWTPNVLEYGFDLDDAGIAAALAYVGMLGRASRLLPEKLTIESNDDDYSKYCSYEHNSYDAISRADGVKYTYTEKDDDYEVKPFVSRGTRSAQPAARSLFRHNPFAFRK